jgi:hypothetical protein
LINPCKLSQHRGHGKREGEAGEGGIQGWSILVSSLSTLCAGKERKLNQRNLLWLCYYHHHGRQAGRRRWSTALSVTVPRIIIIVLTHRLQERTVFFATINSSLAGADWWHSWSRSWTTPQRRRFSASFVLGLQLLMMIMTYYIASLTAHTASPPSHSKLDSQVSYLFSKVIMTMSHHDVLAIIRAEIRITKLAEVMLKKLACSSCNQYKFQAAACNCTWSSPGLCWCTLSNCDK